MLNQPILICDIQCIGARSTKMEYMFTIKLINGEEKTVVVEYSEKCRDDNNVRYNYLFLERTRKIIDLFSGRKRILALFDILNNRTLTTLGAKEYFLKLILESELFLDIREDLQKYSILL